jgi:hypothetical protein
MCQLDACPVAFLLLWIEMYSKPGVHVWLVGTCAVPRGNALELGFGSERPIKILTLNVETGFCRLNSRELLS